MPPTSEPTRFTVSVARTALVPGARGEIPVEVANLSEAPRYFGLRLIGLDPQWTPPLLTSVVVAPGAAISIAVPVAFPAGYPSCQHLAGIEVQALDPATGAPLGAPVTTDVLLDVGEGGAVEASLEPDQVEGKGRFHLTLRNRGIAATTVAFTVETPGTDRARMALSADRVALEPGERAEVDGRIRRRAPLRGPVQRTPFAVTVHSQATPLRLPGLLTRTPLLAGGLTKALAVGALMALWIALLVVGLNQLSNHLHSSSSSGGTATATVQNANGSKGTATTQGGSGGGSSSGSGAGGSSTTLVAAPGKGVTLGGQVASASPGGVKVTVQPTSLVDQTALDTTFNGVAAPARGKLFAPGLPAATPAAATTPTVSTTTDAGGNWSFGNLKTPAYYLLIFEKAGYETNKQIVSVSDASKPVKLDITMVPGRGTASGVTTGPDGKPLGGVKITVSNGSVSLSTQTPTSGNVGAWSIPGLSTPGTYLVTASRDGFGTQTTLVDLGASGNAKGVSLPMAPGTAAITGTVSSPVGPLGGITVSATNGTVTRTATSLSTGPVGTYSLAGLPSPGSYTLTVSGAGWLTQTRHLDLTGGDGHADVQLLASTATVKGTIVRCQAAQNTGSVTGLVLSDATTTLKNVAAAANVTPDTPCPSGTASGQTYEIDGVPPGTYTLTASSFGFTTRSQTVTVHPGDQEVQPRQFQLDAMDPSTITTTASITATVTAQDLGNNPLDLTTTAVTVQVVGAVAKVSTKGTTVQTHDYCSDGPEACTKSADGTITVKNLPPGSYRVTVDATGYQTNTQRAQLAEGQAGVLALNLVPLGNITGIVRETSGAPIPDVDANGNPTGNGITVVAIKSTSTIPQPSCPTAAKNPDGTPNLPTEGEPPGGWPKTDANGQYTFRDTSDLDKFPGLDAGRYLLCFLDTSGRYVSAVAGQWVTVAPPQTAQSDATLDRLAGIIVTVAQSTGGSFPPEIDGGCTASGTDPCATVDVTNPLDNAIPSIPSLTHQLARCQQPAAPGDPTPPAPTTLPCQIGPAGYVVITGLPPALYSQPFTVKATKATFAGASTTVTAALNLNATVNLALVKEPGAVKGSVVWNRDGQQAGIPGLSLTMSGKRVNSATGNADDTSCTTITGSTGTYAFDPGQSGCPDISPVTVIAPSASVGGINADFVLHSPISVNLQDADVNQPALVLTPRPAHLAGTVSFDPTSASPPADLHAVVDAMPSGVSGVTARVDGTTVTLLQGATTCGAPATACVPPGTYKVSVSGTGFQGDTATVFVAPNGDASDTDLVPSGAVTTLAFTMAEHGTIPFEVHSVDTVGGAETLLAGATVTVKDKATGKAVYGPKTLTGTSGDTVPDLPAGTYTITATEIGYGPISGTSSFDVTVNAGGNPTTTAVDTQDLVLQRLATITGTLNGQSGTGFSPLEGVTVTATSSTGVAYAGVTRSDGSFTITGNTDDAGLYPGTYTLSHNATTFAAFDSSVASVTISSAGATDVGELDLASKPATLTVTVVNTDDNDTAVAGAQVQISGPGSTTSMDVPATGGIQTGTADASGKVTFTDLRAGAWQVTVTAPDFAPYFTSVGLTTGQTTNLQATPRTQLNTVKGTVTGSYGTRSQPLAGVTVKATSNSDAKQVTTTTAADGTYEIKGLHGDTYSISFSEDGFNAPGVAQVPLQFGTVYELNATLAAKTRSVTLTVVSAVKDTQGHELPIPHAAVTLQASSGPSDTGTTVSGYSTDASGSVTMNGVEPGAYTPVVGATTTMVGELGHLGGQGSGFTLKPSDTTAFTLSGPVVIAEAEISVTVTVVPSSATPTVSVSAKPATGSAIPLADDGTGALSAFVPAGTYTFDATVSPADAYEVTLPANPVKVASGNHATPTVTVTQLGTISVTVQPVSVTASTISVTVAGTSYTKTLTGSASLTFERVPPGTYDVTGSGTEGGKTVTDEQKNQKVTPGQTLSVSLNLAQ